MREKNEYLIECDRLNEFIDSSISTNIAIDMKTAARKTD